MGNSNETGANLNGNYRSENNKEDDGGFLIPLFAVENNI